MKNDIIKQIYLASIELFPKKCGCGRIYQNEKEYLKRTDKCGVMGEGTDPEYLFLRHCKCLSTIAVAINKQASAKILENIEKISQQENCPVEQIMERIYSLYEEWVNKHEKISTNRILVYDHADSQETRELRIPHTEVIRSTSLEEALNSFQANPEWTRAILLKGSGDYSNGKLFLSSVKNHRDYNKNTAIMGMIEQTLDRNDAPNFDCLTRKHLTKDQLTQFLTNYLRDIIQVI